MKKKYIINKKNDIKYLPEMVLKKIGSFNGIKNLSVKFENKKNFIMEFNFDEPISENEYRYMKRFFRYIENLLQFEYKVTIS